MDNNTTGEVEAKLSRVWEEILVLKDINTDDNFFSLGGHSLMALDLLNEIEEVFQVKLNMKDIVESPTIKDLGRVIQVQKVLTQNSDNQSIHQIEGSYPLTSNQKQLWSLTALNPDTLTHNVSTVLKVNRSLDIELINKSLNYIVSRQEILRTRIKMIQGTPRQVFLPEYRYDLSFIDIKEDELKSAVQNEMTLGFDLENDPLMRIKFYRLNENEYVFFFMVHHIIWDGLSNLLFFHEFNFCYDAFSKGETPDLPTLKMSYKDYALKERLYFESHDFLEQKAEWSKLLSGDIPQLNLPTDYPRKDRPSTESETHYLNIGTELLNELEQYAQTRFISLYNIFFAAFKVTLAKVTGDLDLIVGTPVHGRHMRETRKTFGYFINSLPIRTKLKPEQSFKYNLGLLLESLKVSFHNQNVPLDQIIQVSQTQTLYKTLFVYLDITKELDQFDQYGYEQIKAERSSSHTEIDFYLHKSRDKVEGAIEFRKELFDVKTIRKFGEIFKSILKEVITNEFVTLEELGVHNLQKESIAPKIEDSIQSKVPTNYESHTIKKVELIWERVLELKDLDIDAHFFNLGGHSILAVEIFSIINDEFNIDLPLSIIFENSTVRELSYAIDQELNSQENFKRTLASLKTIVAIKTCPKNQENIFCFHGVGGNVLNYYPLSEYVGKKNFYGVQSLGVNGMDRPVESIPEMARLYIKELRLIQKKGPYILAGGSMGGMVALEVAKQLKTQGEAVRGLIMFDTYGPNFDPKRFGKTNVSTFQRLLWGMQYNLHKIINDTKLNIYLKTKKSLPHSIRYYFVERQNSHALRNYHPQSYQGDVILIRAPEAKVGHYADPHLGWNGIIDGKISVKHIVGSHTNLIESPELSDALHSIMRKI